MDHDEIIDMYEYAERMQRTLLEEDDPTNLFYAGQLSVLGRMIDEEAL